jgi:hypothetical protein
VRIELLCVGEPSNFRGKPAVTDDKGLAAISYTCNDEQTFSILVSPPNRKEQCGDDAEMSFKVAVSVGIVSSPLSDGEMGGLGCPTRVSKNLKPIPGQVIMFVKKPTWGSLTLQDKAMLMTASDHCPPDVHVRHSVLPAKNETPNQDSTTSANAITEAAWAGS